MKTGTFTNVQDSKIEFLGIRMFPPHKAYILVVFTRTFLLHKTVVKLDILKFNNLDTLF